MGEVLTSQITHEDQVNPQSPHKVPGVGHVPSTGEERPQDPWASLYSQRVSLVSPRPGRDPVSKEVGDALEDDT